MQLTAKSSIRADKVIHQKEKDSLRIILSYRNLGLLMQDLSHNLNRGEAPFESKSPFPDDTPVEIEMVTPTLENAIVIPGKIVESKWSNFNKPHELLVRYEFDPEKSREVLDEALDKLIYQELPDYRQCFPRIPVDLEVDAKPIGADLYASIQNMSAGGCKFEAHGSELPRVGVGDRLKFQFRSGFFPVKKAIEVDLEVIWLFYTGKKVKKMMVGGRFLQINGAAKELVEDILRFEEYSPVIRLTQHTVAP